MLDHLPTFLRTLGEGLSAPLEPDSCPHCAPAVTHGEQRWENGWALTDPIPPSTKPVVRRKTLQLDFKRPGDRYVQRPDEVRFLRSEWIYRGSQIEVPGLPSAASPAKAEEGAPK